MVRILCNDAEIEVPDGEAARSADASWRSTMR